ncbi:MAG: ABC transporter permease subunit [Micromonosporaceae bacterium]|nr:ABC transporter permease subunit [Micromonosporaceae bacterium]
MALTVVAGAVTLAAVLQMGRFAVSEGRGRGWSTDTVEQVASDPFYWQRVLESLQIAGWITVATMAIGVPTAMALHRAGPTMRALGFAVIIVPLAVSVVVRAYGWMLTLGRLGPLGRLLEWLGVADGGLRYGSTAVVISMAHILLPFMVFPVYQAANRMDPQLLEAGRDLGAGRLRLLSRVLLPQLAAGIAAGGGLVFALGISAFMSPALLGGGRVDVLATQIYRDLVELQWARSSVLAIILLVVALSGQWVLRRALDQLARARA